MCFYYRKYSCSRRPRTEDRGPRTEVRGQAELQPRAQLQMELLIKRPSSKVQATAELWGKGKARRVWHGKRKKEHPSRGCRVMPFNVPAINLSEFAGTEALYTAHILYPCAAVVGQQMRILNGLQNGQK